MKPPVKLLQERDFGQKINATFDFIGQHFKPLMMCMLYIAGPAAVVAGVAQGVYQSDMFSMVGETKSNNPLIDGLTSNQFTISYFISLFFILIASSIASITVYSYVLEYEKRGEDNTSIITPADVWTNVRGNILQYIGIGFVLIFLIILGLVILIIPGIYIAVPFTLVFFIILREKISLGNGMSRAFLLIQDKWWSTFGLIIVMSIIQSILSYVFLIPQFAVMMLSAFKIIKGDISLAVNAITGVVSMIGQILMSCLVTIAVAFQYYNLVERREGTSMLDAIDSIGEAEKPRTDLREEEF